MRSHQANDVSDLTKSVRWHPPQAREKLSITTSIDDSKSVSCQSSEKKEDASESHLEPVSENETVPLYYLANIDTRHHDELITLFAKPLDELEALIKKHSYYYRFRRIENSIAISMNLLELVYLTRTSNEGINAIASYLFPGVQLPNQMIYAIGIPWALTDCLLYTFVFSPHIEALKSTLSYATRKPLPQRISTYLEQCYAHPQRSLLAMSCFMVNQAILLNCNLTESLTDIIDILWLFEKLPPIIYWSTIATVLYLGNLYYSKYANLDYYEGLKFWLNEDNLPYLYQEMRRKNISMPLQILLQGACAVGLDIFPFYYYLAVAAKDELGWWTPATLTSIFSGIHGLCVLYPATYFHYMENSIEISRIIRKEHADSIRQTLMQLHQDTLIDKPYLEKAIETELEKIKTDAIAKTTRHQPSFCLFKNTPAIFIPILIKAALGGYLGYIALHPLFLAIAKETISSTVFSSLIGASVFSSGLYKIEKYRLMTELTANELRAEEQKRLGHESHTTESSPKSCLTSTTNAIASILNVGSGLTNATSTVGTATRLFGSKNNYALPSVALFAMERMSNSIIYNMNKVESTFSHALNSAHESVSKMSFRLFCTKKPAVAPTEPTTHIELTMNSSHH